jgi:hypothetical protein
VGAWPGTLVNSWAGLQRAVTPSQLTATALSVAPAAPGADRGSTSNNELLASISNLMDVPATSFGTGYPGTMSALA